MMESIIQSGLNTRRVSNLKPGHTIVRTGNLGRITVPDLLLLKLKYDIIYYFDLRNSSEIVPREWSKRFAQYGLRWMSFPLGDFPASFRKKLYPTPEDYACYYMIILLNDRQRIRELLNFIATTPNCYSFVIGCSAGKDRTGLIIYLLLKIGGISIDTIALDYELSNNYLLKDIEFLSLHRKKRNITEEDYIKRITAKKETIYILDSLFQEKYGNIWDYLQDIGMCKSNICSIQERFHLEVGGHL